MVEKLILVSHVASTWAMVGVILVIQIVHYPLFSSVGAAGFGQYEALHARRITWVVGPLMLIELLTAVALVVRPPGSVSAILVWSGLAVLAVIWASTAFLQVPLHQHLAAGFDLTAHRKLVTTNWVRTVGWILRGLLVATMLIEYVRRPIALP